MKIKLLRENYDGKINYLSRFMESVNFKYNIIDKKLFLYTIIIDIQFI